MNDIGLKLKGYGDAMIGSDKLSAFTQPLSEISKSVIKESTKLSKKLKLPDISQAVLDVNDLD